jgi:alkyl hydroperoxide reductase subunit AhpF
MYDLLIIGGSAAGASAAVYAARRGLNFAVIAKDFGGEVALSGDVDNWLGIKHTTGAELAQSFSEHMKSYNPKLIEDVLVSNIEKKADGMFAVTTDDGAIHESKAVLIATGAHSRELGVPGEKEYRLKGVSYCTVCDGPVFSGKNTVTIGGGNSALESALMLADICPHVTVINKNPAFKGEKTLIEKLTAKANVDIVYEAMTTEITGDGKFANGVKYKTKDGTEHTIEMSGAFVHIGQTPNTKMVPAVVERDEFGYVKIGVDGTTSMPGLFAAGDVTFSAHKQIIIAAGQGAAACLSAVQYINRLA